MATQRRPRRCQFVLLTFANCAPCSVAAAATVLAAATVADRHKDRGFARCCKRIGALHGLAQRTMKEDRTDAPQLLARCTAVGQLVFSFEHT